MERSGRNQLFTCVLAILALVLLGATIDRAGAAAILLADHRSLEVTALASRSFAINSDGDSAVPSVPFAPFADVITAFASVPGAETSVTASQTSTVTPTLFTANGELQIQGSVESGGLSQARGQSFFHIEFELLTPHEFDLSGALAGNVPFLEVGLFGGEGTIEIHGAPGAFVDTGVLPPGTYLLQAFATTGEFVNAAVGDLSGSFTLDFVLTQVNGQVPEPGTLLLLIAGAAGVAALKRVRG